MIPPNGTVNLVVQFASESVGKFTEMLAFDVVCGDKSNKVTLMAACDYPRISTEARCVFAGFHTLRVQMHVAMSVRSCHASHQHQKCTVKDAHTFVVALQEPVLQDSKGQAIHAQCEAAVHCAQQHV